MLVSDHIPGITVIDVVPIKTLLLPCEAPKPFPVMTRPIPVGEPGDGCGPGPSGSDRPRMSGARVKSTWLLAVVPTVTTTYPVVVPTGTVTVMLVGAQQEFEVEHAD